MAIVVNRGGRVTLPQAYAFGAAGARQVVLIDTTRNYVEWRRNAIAANTNDASIATRHGNVTAAALGAQQRSPMAALQGNAWNTGAGASRAVEFAQQVTPTQGASDAAILTGSALLWASQVAGGGWGAIAELGGDGQLRAGDGTAALPGQSFRSTPDMGGRRVSATQYGMSTAGVHRYALDATRMDLSGTTLGVRDGAAAYTAGFLLQLATATAEGRVGALSTSVTGNAGLNGLNNLADQVIAVIQGSAIGGGNIWGKSQNRLALVIALAQAMAIGTLNAVDVVIGSNQVQAMTFVGSASYCTMQRRFQRGQGAAVSAAASTTLGTGGNIYQLTGSTDVNTILTTDWQDGSEITIECEDTFTVADSTGNIHLDGDVDFLMQGEDLLHLELVNGEWYELGRRVGA